MKKEFVCIVCPAGCRLAAEDGNISGYTCERGLRYAESELNDPKRSVSSTVKLVGGALRRLPVKTDRPIAKDLVCAAVKQLDGVVVAAPVAVGDIILKNVLGSSVNFIATRPVGRENGKEQGAKP